jgi:hypothetical protein
VAREFSGALKRLRARHSDRGGHARVEARPRAREQKLGRAALLLDHSQQHDGAVVFAAVLIGALHELARRLLQIDR